MRRLNRRSVGLRLQLEREQIECLAIGLAPAPIMAFAVPLPGSRLATAPAGQAAGREQRRVPGSQAQSEGLSGRVSFSH